MFQPNITRRAALAIPTLLIAASMLAGCAAAGSDRQPGLGDALLTLADVRGASDAPADLIDRPDQVVPRVMAAGEAPVVTPWLCGDATEPSAPVPEKRVLAIYSSDLGSMTVAQWVYRVGPDQGRKLFAEFDAHLRPGCRPVRSQGEEGTQTSEVLEELPLPAIVDDRVGASLRLTLDDQVSYGTLVALRTDSLFSYFLVTASQPIPPPFATDLAVEAAEKMGAGSA